MVPSAVPRAQAQFDATLMILQATPNWEAADVEEFKVLTGKHKGLGEIRFHINVSDHGSRRPYRRRFRPVGIWPPIVEGEFIILVGCEKRRATYTPHAAFDIALMRKVEFEKGKGSTSEHI